MAKTFTNGGPSDYDRMTRLCRQYHPALADHEIRVALTFVRAFDKDEEPITALKFAGAPANAVVKLLSPERKLREPFDAEIRVDGHIWDDLTDSEKDALIDHELTHIKLVTDANGVVITNDDNSPKLKLIPDDVILTAFLEVIRRHGDNCLDYKVIKTAGEAAANQLLNLLNEQPQPAAA